MGPTPAPAPRRTWPWAVAGSLVAAALGAWPVVTVTGSPVRVPQAPDTIFHLGTVMTMVATGDASTLHATAYTAAGGAGGYYPAAFHVVAASVALLAGSQAVVACTTVALVTAVVVWPLGVLALAREVLGPRPVVLLGAPVAAIALAPFPTWFLGYGVLWPNLLGQALVAGVVAVAVGPVLRERSVVGVLVALAGTAGVALAHPNGLFALLVVVGVAVLAHAAVVVVTAGRRRTRFLTALGVLVALGVGAGGWLVVTRASRSLRGSNPAGAEMSWTDAAVDVLFSAARDLRPSWVAGGLVVVGAVSVLRRGRPWWVALAWASTAGLYLAVAAVDSYWTRLVTWPWYNNSPRLAALVVLPAAVLLVAALALLHDLAVRVLRRGDRDSGVVAVGVLTVVVAATLGANLPARTEVLDATFRPPAARTWVSDDELDALRAIGDGLPTGAVVAANPWSGGTYLYPVSGRRLLYPTEKVRGSSPDLALLARRLDRAGEDAQVCAALRERGVEWALTGGEPASRSRGALTGYVGIDGVGASDAWTRVRTEGPYTLYRLTTCREA